MCAAVIGGCNCAEPLLAGCVPDLKLHPIAPDVDGPDFEVDANGGDVVSREGVVGEAHEERALAHAGVADDEQLEEVVVVLPRRRTAVSPGHPALLGQETVMWISMYRRAWMS